MAKLIPPPQKEQRVVVRRIVVRIILDECGLENRSVDSVPPETVIGPPIFDDNGFLKDPGLNADVSVLDAIQNQINRYIGTHGYFELGASAFLDQAHHYTAGVTYTRGEDAPDFEDLNKNEAWVGLQF